jgi:hypothetical protein
MPSRQTPAQVKGIRRGVHVTAAGLWGRTWSGQVQDTRARGRSALVRLAEAAGDDGAFPAGREVALPVRYLTVTTPSATAGPDG